MKEVRKVKSIQIFRKPAQQAMQGDRAGICVTQFDASLLERGLVSSPGLLPNAFAIIIDLKKIRFYKSDIVSGSKFHVSIGHATILSTITLFSEEKLKPDEKTDLPFSLDKEYAYLPILATSDESSLDSIHVYALVEFDHSAVISCDSKILGSKLDTDVHTSSCRLAFEGQILLPITSEKYKTEILPRLKVFKIKEKAGNVERANNDYELIGKNMFKKETNIHLFDGFKVAMSTPLSTTGAIDGPFGQSGKFKIRLSEPLSEEAKSLLGGGKKKKAEDKVSGSEVVEVRMTFKKYLFTKKMAQR